MKRIVFKALRRLAGFGSSTIVNGAVALFAFPVIVVVAGPTVWGGIAVAQSIAGLAAVVVAFGWGVMGPAGIASAPVVDRGQQYADSLVLRTLLLLTVMPVTIYLIVLWAPGNLLADIFAGAAMTVAAVGGFWFYVGEGKAWRLFLLDTIPRSCGSIAGALLLALTGNVIFFAAAQLAGALVAVSAAAIDILYRHTYQIRLSMSVRRQILSFRTQIPGTLTAAASSLYMNAPLTILASLAPASVPVYAMGDKIMRFAVMAMSPLTQIAQSSVPSFNPERQVKNIQLATKASTAAAVTSGLALTLTMPLGSEILSAGNIEVTTIVSAAFGLTLGSITFSQICGHATLMVLGRAKTVAASATLGLCVAIPAVCLAAPVWGGAGAAWALGGAELAVAVFQFIVLKRAMAPHRLPEAMKSRGDKVAPRFQRRRSFADSGAD